ncbi:uncharacterized protein GBIM_20714 [Gryllus bimaculatus]|nr:uncharacterized protein GBIM_20714 [Gryllus bimaculatus]
MDPKVRKCGKNSLQDINMKSPDIELQKTEDMLQRKIVSASASANLIDGSPVKYFKLALIMSQCLSVLNHSFVNMFLRHIFIAPAPNIMATISSAFNSPLNRRDRDRLQIVRPANESKEVDERSREIGAVVAQLSGFVIPREHVQPAHVREEEAAAGVVRVGVRLAVLVVHAVVAHPLVDVVLEGQRVDHHEEEAERPLGLVRAVTPQAVGAGGDGHGGQLKILDVLNDWIVGESILGSSECCHDVRPQAKIERKFGGRHDIMFEDVVETAAQPDYLTQWQGAQETARAKYPGRAKPKKRTATAPKVEQSVWHSNGSRGEWPSSHIALCAAPLPSGRHELSTPVTSPLATRPPIAIILFLRNYALGTCNVPVVFPGHYKDKAQDPTSSVARVAKYRKKFKNENPRKWKEFLGKDRNRNLLKRQEDKKRLNDEKMLKQKKRNNMNKNSELA